MNERRDVIIVGGGISGLTAAYTLQKKAPHLKITLLERNGRLGGNIHTLQQDGFTIEAGPDCFLARKPRGVGLCEELGIADQFIGRNPAHKKTFVLRHGRLHPLPEGLTGMIPTNLDALTNSTLLSDNGRLQIAQEPNQPVPAETAVDESLASFVSRRFGQEAFENLIEPLMGGIYAGKADQLSLAATFPQLRQLELKHGSLIKGLTTNRPATTEQPYPPFVSLPNGMGQLVDALVEKLDAVEILTDAEVTAVTQSDNEYLLTISHNSTQQSPNYPITQLPNYPITNYQSPTIIFATPAYVSGKLIQNIDPILAEALCDIPHASTALVNMTFDEADLPEKLDGYGYVIPTVEGKEALACTWSSLKWNGRSPQGKLLLRVYIGRFGTDVTQCSDERLLNIAKTELEDTLNISIAPTSTHIQRWPNGMPQYNMGHQERIKTVEARINSHNGLFLAGNYFRGVGIPDAIQAGESAAGAVMDDVSRLRVNSE